MLKTKYTTLLIVVLSIVLLSFNKIDTIDEEHLGEWNIRNGVFMSSKSKYNSLAKYNWDVFLRIFPNSVTKKYIRKIVLISDGLDEKAGALGALTTKNDQWQLVIDTVDVNFKSSNKDRLYQSVYTLIHEFGHLITLNNTQIEPALNLKQDPNAEYVTIEGKAYKDSYINMFVKQFWNGGLLNEWDYIQKKYCFVEQIICTEKLYSLYEDNYNDFLTDYAAESPEEDIVESWTWFVLKDKVADPKTVAQQKINFFYQFPKLVEYRAHIRRNTTKYINH